MHFKKATDKIELAYYIHTLYIISFIAKYIFSSNKQLFLMSLSLMSDANLRFVLTSLLSEN